MFLNFIYVLRIIFREFEWLSFFCFLPVVACVSLGLGLLNYSSCHPRHLNLIRAFLIQSLEQIPNFQGYLRYQVYQPMRTEPMNSKQLSYRFSKLQKGFLLSPTNNFFVSQSWTLPNIYLFGLNLLWTLSCPTY